MTVDTSPPVAGYLYDGDDMFNAYQSTTETITASWTGFRDDESGIVVRTLLRVCADDGQGYQWAAGTAPGGTDLFTWRPTKSDTEATANLLVPLTAGEVNISKNLLESDSSSSMCLSVL